MHLKCLFGLVAWLLIMSQAGCHAPVTQPIPEPQYTTSVYVVNHGWHTGIVIPRDHIPDQVWPEHHDFSPATYIEVGWGDQAFYQAPKTSLGLALKAALQATPSVLHIVGFTMPVTVYYSQSDIIEVPLSQAGFERLGAFVHNTYKTDAAGRTLPLGRGPYGTSQFYQARGSYHLFNTCNTWTAQALQAAGCPIKPSRAITAAHVMRQASRFGHVVRVKSMELPRRETFCRPPD